MKLVFPIHWSQVLSREWRCSWSSADRRCSNYILVMKKYCLLRCSLYWRIDGMSAWKACFNDHTWSKYARWVFNVNECVIISQHQRHHTGDLLRNSFLSLGSRYFRVTRLSKSYVTPKGQPDLAKSCGTLSVKFILCTSAIHFFYQSALSAIQWKLNPVEIFKWPIGPPRACIIC